MAGETRKVAFVTGSGRKRVGQVIAQSLARDGYDVALHYNSSAVDAKQTADKIRGLGVDCEAFQADVSSEHDVDRMFDSLTERFARLDVLVTTASIWESTPLEQVTADDLVRSLGVNTIGTFLCARRAGLIMADQAAGGAIITIGDWAIERPYLNHAAYFLGQGGDPLIDQDACRGTCSS